MEAEVVVVGAGIMGSATAYALAREGRDVLLVEQFQIGHEQGSSHGRSRIVRLAYPEVEFVELAKESFAGWRKLEQESGQTLLELNGLLEIVEQPAQSSSDALDAAGAEYELLDAGSANRRWPVGVPDGWTALFQPEAGIVRADLAHRAFIDRAVEEGAHVTEETRIESLDDTSSPTCRFERLARPWPTFDERALRFPLSCSWTRRPGGTPCIPFTIHFTASRPERTTPVARSVPTSGTSPARLWWSESRSGSPARIRMPTRIRSRRRRACTRRRRTSISSSSGAARS